MCALTNEQSGAIDAMETEATASSDKKDRAWTKEQEAAIYARGTGIIVSAAAGSGKTSVLVERLIEILSDKKNRVPADRIVVVTFTNDAAAQMKQRLSDEFAKKIAKDPGDEWLCSQQTMLQTAKISTIHSFCFDMIRENIQLVDFSSSFRILDEAEERTLQRNAVAEAFEKFYADEKSRSKMEVLCNFFSHKFNGDAELEETVLDIYKYLVSIPFYEDWMKKWKEYYSAGFDPKNDPIADEYIEYLKKSCNSILGQVDYANGLYSDAFGEDSEALEKDKIIISDLIKVLDSKIEWDKKMEFQKPKLPAMTSPKDKTDEQKEVMERITKKIRNKYKNDLNNVIEQFFMIDEINKDYEKHSEILENLFSLIECFDAELHRLKMEKNALSFSDAEQIAVKLLAEKDSNGNIVRTKLAEELSEYYELIMIDEFQDANNNQDLIFKMLSKGGTAGSGGINLFTVGDAKQSIYRFRLANLKLFRKALEDSQKYTGEDFKGTNASITLNRNFRSSREVIDFVNYIFGQLMSERVGEVNYTDSEALVQGLEYPPDCDRTTEIIIVPDEFTAKNESGAKNDSDSSSAVKAEASGESNEESAEPEKDDEERIRSIRERSTVFSDGSYTDDDGNGDINGNDDDDSGSVSVSSEAKAAAMKIRSMLGVRKVVDKNAARPCEPRDFCILLRKSRFADAYINELAALGIKAHTEGPKGYLKSREISVLMSMLAVIDNPMQDIHLAAVLMSPMFMLDAEDMAKLAEFKERREKYFSVVKRVLDGQTEIKNDSQLYMKLDRFMKTFRKLRYDAASQRLERFIRTIYDSTDFLSSVQVYADGEQKKANLRLLLDIAEGYENNSDGGIQGFVRYMDNLLKRGEDMERASTVSSGENAVSVKTIHKSKGLEYPFVFLCETSTNFILEDTKKDMQINSDFGIAFRIRDRKELKKYDSFPQLAIADINKMGIISEEMRLLYVALTRAREQLFITVPDNEKVRGRIDYFRSRINSSEGLTADIVLEANSMLDWISAAMAVHSDGGWFRGDDKDLPVVKTAAKVLVRTFSGEVSSSEEADEQKAAVPDENAVRRLREAFDFDYRQKYEEDRTEQPAKITVTEISKKETGKDFEPRIPELAGRGELTAAEKGTAMHTFMQYADYSKAENAPAYEAEELVRKGILTEEEKNSLNLDQLAEFFDSELYKRIKAAYAKNSDLVRREQKFLIKKSDSGLDDKRLMEYNDDSMIQGIADCMFEENGKVVLVDYKTDRVDNSDTLISRYDLQIKLYAKALNRIFGMEVREAYLYSFCLGMAVPVPLD